LAVLISLLHSCVDQFGQMERTLLERVHSAIREEHLVRWV
jgi:hypothetical protein